MFIYTFTVYNWSVGFVLYSSWGGGGGGCIDFITLQSMFSIQYQMSFNFKYIFMYIYGCQ